VRYLVDANVLSEAMRPAPDLRVVRWLIDHEAELVVTPIVLGEIEYGILLLAAGKQRRQLQSWFDERVRSIVTVDFDAQTASAWARLLAKLKQNATPMPVKDSLIAASGLRHDLTIATRNIADFRKTGVGLVNPFD
jgi:predicted nucleic acid-binding protein